MLAEDEEIVTCVPLPITVTTSPEPPYNKFPEPEIKKVLFVDSVYGVLPIILELIKALTAKTSDVHSKQTAKNKERKMRPNKSELIEIENTKDKNKV